MDSIHRFSESVIDLAERLSNVADAAAGNPPTKGRNGAAGTTTRWVILPAAGAGLFALAKSDFFTRQAKGVMDEAKTRASDLPNDLMKRVRQTAPKSTSQTSTSSQRSSTSSQRSSTKSGNRGGRQRSGSQRRRQTSASRNSKSG
jgi:hypothetical protein